MPKILSDFHQLHYNGGMKELNIEPAPYLLIVLIIDQPFFYQGYVGIYIISADQPGELRVASLYIN